MDDMATTAPKPTEHRHVERSRRERGAGLVEYALLVALITLACVASLRVFGVTNGGSVNNSASTYASALN